MQHKQSTKEEYQKRINKMVEYIHNHLDENIELGTLAEMSGFSSFHFHRIARAFLGESVGAFIMRVRVETAAHLLRYSDMTIRDIAWRVGYDMPSSLSKSFRQFFGISPNEYRNNKDYTIMKPLHLNQELKLKAPKIIEIETKKVIYIRLTGSYGSLDYSGTWGRLWNFVKEQKLFSAGIECFAIYHNDPKITESAKLHSDLCLTIHKPVEAKGEIGVKEIPGGKCAVFLYQGPYSNLDVVYDTIFSQWLPESGCRLRSIPCYEKYMNNPDRTAPEKLKTEIYIPIE